MTATLGTVMIIDDEDIDQRQYKRLLLRSGMTERILQFAYADEALEWLLTRSDSQIDLIFLDVNIPRMSGFEFLEAAQHHMPGLSGLNIIMLSTSLDPEDRARAALFPAVRAFFNKPLTTDHLLKAAQLLKDT